ncbi:phosphatase PAP2 family protein [Xenophilus arseniciresistens]|uniref:Phosphatase PAP2 family protein n=1 Tax=Xenophilus arseniciresistens TaxID=1283306 RepID=A0AAE3N9Q2_9BURK|nr:phosphatase PAP2 family protein [Xenophilus arseniciresistens]MDA7416412.1 phosphatase PAP2 family protein [Xenophilus arseniciresistens]
MPTAPAPARRRARPDANPLWARHLWRRVIRLWPLKMLGTMAGIGGFFALYFWTLEHTAARAVVVPTLFADAWFGLQPWSVVPYGSLWLYVSLAPAFAANLAALRAYVRGAALIVALAMACYWLFPTVTPDFGVDWSQHPGLQFLKAADAGGNAFPSLHVAFAFYTALVIGSQLRSLGAPLGARAFNWLWCLAILHSTLATHQHVLLDVLGGLATTWLAVALAWRRRARVAQVAQVAPVALAAEFTPRPIRRISRR